MRDQDKTRDQLLAELQELRQQVVALEACQESWRQSEETLRAIYKDIRISLFVVDVDLDGDFRLAGLNPAHEHLTGLTNADLAGKRPEEIRGFSQAGAAALRANYRRCVEARETVSYEESLVINGNETWWLTRLTPLFDGDRIYRIIGSSVNIDEHRETEQALRESLKKYQTLFHAFPLGITVSSKTGDVVESNAKAEELLGVPKENHEQRTIDGPEWRIICLDGSPMPAEEWASVKALRENRLVKDVQMGIVKEDGDTVWINVTATPIPLEDYGVLVAYSDITEQKRTQEDLVIKNQAINSTINAIALADNSGNLTYVNSAFLDLWGYPDTTKVLGQHSTSFWQMEDKAEAVIKALQTSGSWRGELVAKRRDDTLFDTELTASVIVGTDDAPVGMMASFVDVTPRKQAQIALRESEAKYRTLFLEMPPGLALHQIIYDENDQPVNYRFLDANPAFERLTGLRNEDILGKTVLEVLPDTEEHWIDTYGKVALTGQSIHFEQFSRALDKYYSVSAFCPKPGQFVTAFTDITDRINAEEQLRESARRLSLATEAVNMGIWDWNIKTNTLVWDEKNYELYQGDPDDFEGIEAAWRKRLHPDDIEAEMALVQAVLAGEKEYHTRFRIIWPDGQVRYMESHATLRQAEDGTPIRLVGVNWDITEQVTLAEEHKQLQEQFYQAQKMESIGKLAGGIAHDFNNLLVPILGYAELGLMIINKNDGFYDQLVQIRQSAERAADLTRQILAFSRQQMLEMTIVNINEIVSGFEKMLQRLIGEDVTLLTRLAAITPSVKADKGQIEQVLLNLAVNARDAMPSGGILNIETDNIRLDDDSVARLPDLKSGLFVRLSVSDTGFGMDEETRQLIFEPFFTTKERGQGTGLGLATVYGIIKQHQGDVDVSSHPGQGTTFEIYLPVIEAQTESGKIERADAAVTHGTETILVVEDEEAVRSLVCDTLISCGYTVLEAESSEAGLSLAATYHSSIDLLLTDVIMPEMDGHKLYREIVRNRPGVKVLFISGYTDNLIARYGIFEQDVPFLQKPFTIRDLQKKVREVLG